MHSPIPRRGYLLIAIGREPCGIPRRGYLLIAMDKEPCDIPRRGYLLIAINKEPATLKRIKRNPLQGILAYGPRVSIKRKALSGYY